MSDNQRNQAEQRKAEAEAKAQAVQKDEAKTLAEAREAERQKAIAEETDRINAEAKAEAQKIREDAEAEAKQIREQAEAEAKAFQETAKTVDLPAEELQRRRRGTEGTITSDATGLVHDKTGRILRDADPTLLRITETRDAARKTTRVTTRP